MKTLTCLPILALLLVCGGCERPVDEAQRYVDRGAMHLEAEQYEEALGFYRKAIDADPLCEDAYLQIALLYDEHLGDKSNAVLAYEAFLDIAKNAANREKAKSWLAQARSDADVESADAASTDSQSVERRFQEELVRRERQFSSLRQQLADRHETEVEAIRQEVLDAEERCAALESENNAFRLDSEHEQTAAMLDRIASNETLIAELQTELERKEEETDAALHGQDVLQSLVTNLQACLREQATPSQYLDELLASNALLLTEQKMVMGRIASMENQQTELQMKFAEVNVEYAQATSQAPTEVSAAIEEPAVPLTPELLESFETAKREIAELKRREKFNEQERAGFVDTVDSLRNLIDQRSEQLNKAKRQLAKYDALPVSVAEAQRLNKELERERATRKRRDKLLYDRTVQLKRLQQRYAATQQQYQNEVNRRRKVSNVLAQLQNEMKTAPAEPTGRASAGQAARTPRTTYPSGTAGRSRYASGAPTASRTSRQRTSGTMPRTTTTRKRTGVTTPSRRTAPRPTAPSRQRTYTVQKGDSLTRIAERIYGDKRKWEAIYSANRDTLKRPNELRIGQVLRIP